MARSTERDKLYKAIGKGERTSKKVAIIQKTDGTSFRRRNANGYGNAEGGNDYVEKRPNRTDFYPKDKRKKIMETGGKTTEEMAYEKEQHDYMFNSQFAKGSTVKDNRMNERTRAVIVRLQKTKADPEYVSPNYVNDVANKMGVNLTSEEVVFISDNFGEKYAKGSTVEGGGVEKITQAELLNENFKEAKENIIEIHKRVKLKSGNELLLLKKESGWGISKYNPKTKKELEWYEFSDKETANYWIDKVDVEKYAKGSTIKGKSKKKKVKQPMVVRGYFEDEAYEYGQGGKTNCWCYSIGGL